MDPALRDLAAFARFELAAADIEPWAAVIAATRTAGALDDEAALWAVKLYNAYDDLGSAWRVLGQWAGPGDWAAPGDHTAAAGYPCSRERRSLRGGRITLHLDSYVGQLAGATQMGWLREAIPARADPAEAFLTLMPYLRRVWGVGRQTAFEWAEFAAKVLDLPVETPDACLWESSGPRQSLERLYGNPNPTLEWLNKTAGECRAMLADEGAVLSWWDFETVICDFNVMRKGRYYPGQHLAMIREEIEGLPDPHRTQLRAAFASVVPEPWCRVAPGVDKQLARAYRDTGRIRLPAEVEG